MKENKAGNDDLQEMIKKVQEELQRQNKQDVENCGSTIEAALKKFDCRLEPVFVFTSKGMLPPQINIEKNPVQPGQAKAP